VLGRSAPWNARPRVTASDGSVCSAASWSARGAGGVVSGTRSSVTATAAATSTTSVTVAHTRGVIR
jgi:hypothetical protein